ncbi:MAG: hypothetical protein ACRDGT_01580 [Candidatus Limnocylindria bacterium]
MADFPDRRSVGSAIAALARAGFGPERVEVVAGDPELARDIGGRSYVRAGVLTGAVLGILFAALVLAMGGAEMSANPVGFTIGAIGVIGGLSFIGLVFGRSIVRRGPDAALFASEVERGDALVCVCCEGETCQKAEEVLVKAGATDIRQEASPGPT